MINGMAVVVETEGISRGSDIRVRRLYNVAPRCVKHSTLGTFAVAASANASDNAWNSAGSYNAPLKASSILSKKIFPASSTQNSGS